MGDIGQDGPVSSAGRGFSRPQEQRGLLSGAGPVSHRERGPTEAATPTPGMGSEQVTSQCPRLRPGGHLMPAGAGRGLATDLMPPRLQPLHVVCPEQYTQPPPTQCHRTDLMIDCQPPPMSYRRAEVLALPFKRRYEKIEIMPEVSSVGRNGG